MIAALLLGSAGAYAQAPQAGRYTTLTANELLDFRYSFPTIVGSHPALLAKIRADQNAQYNEYLKTARQDAAERKDDHDFPFHRYEFWRDWTIASEAFPLLSLQSHVDDFTGGAHPNHYSSAILWNEKSDAEVNLNGLFGGPGKLWNAIKANYCRKLDAERRRRKTDSVGCPARKELTVVPVDSDFNYRIDTLRIIADPYVAGSYADGAYVVSLPITVTLLKSIDPKYRSSFEVQRQ